MLEGIYGAEDPLIERTKAELRKYSNKLDIPKEISGASKVVDDFLGKFKPKWKLDVKNPITFGNIIGPSGYYKVRKAMQNAHENAKKLIPQIAKEWKERTGKYHGDL